MKIDNKYVFIIGVPLFIIAVLAFIIHGFFEVNEGIKQFRKERTMSAEQYEWLDALKAGNRIKIQKMLKSGSQVDLRIPIIRYNDRGADSGLRKMTGLMIACERGDYEMAKLLLQNGAQVNANDSDWVRTPLIYALIGKNRNIVKLLVDKGADVNWMEHRYRFTTRPLFYAIRDGKKDVVELIVRAGADVNAKQSDGDTPFSLADRKGLEDIKKLLLARGAKKTPEPPR